jgi:hypothetical protein
MSLTPASAPAVELEREELDWLLTSSLLSRSQNLVRMLTFICEEYFEGRAECIKEYTIAVEALGRRADFDPQTDTIVRVTIHALRKRLLEIYQNEGADHRVRIVIPPGHYAPSFVHIIPQKALSTPEPFEAIGHAELAVAPGGPALSEAICDPKPGSALLDGTRTSWRLVWLLLAVLGLAAVAIFVHRRGITLAALETRQEHSPVPPAPADSIHALMGASRQPYVDHSGIRWTSGNYCSNGVNVRIPDQKIVGTEDSYLYLAGTRGISHCIFPMKPGLYELHLYFAETSDLQVATRVATISVNAGPNVGIDVVDDAGGDGIATSRVLTGVAPENDGAIHLDFVSEVSLLNAVEILPAPSDKLLPVRIVAASAPFTDSSGQHWLSDRYFSGGRPGLSPDTPKLASLGMFGYDRVGNFHYSIPVVPLQYYRVKLFFRDPWFGKENDGAGGPGSRIFDVSCNGSVMLRNFDILAEGGNGPVVKTFDNVQATALGKIELYFTPVVNYPVVNAIEVLPEP